MDEHGTTVGEPSGLSFWEEFRWYWQRWPAKGMFFCLLAAWLLLFQFLGNSTLGYIETRSLFGWMRYSYSQSADDQHGYLIPIVVLMLFWWKRKELLAVAEEAWMPGIAIVALGLLVHLVGYRVQQTRISILGFAVGLYGLLGAVWGRRFMLSSSFPMILFIFSIPLSTVGDTLTYPLRILVTKISVAIGHEVLAMPIVRDGSQILGPDGVYDVAPACSGIRSLTALGAVTLIYAFVTFSDRWKRLAVLAAAIPLAVAGNVGRVTSVLILGDVFGKGFAMQLEQYLGLVTFTVALGCLLVLGYWLQRREVANT
jgi:exosortase